MRRCKARDFYPLPSSREIQPGTGFLRAPAKINRTGIQVYSGRELGLDEWGDKPVRLWRPPEEVAKAVKTFEAVTLTDDHPPRGVDAVNWHLLAKGDVRDCAMEGEFTAATVIVRDQEQIEVVQGGKAELSCGYEFNLDMTSGTTPEGEPYDGIQRDIVGNHVAIVDRGRAGSRVRIGDQGARMKTHRIKIGDTKLTDKLVIPGFEVDLELDDVVARQVNDKFDLHAHGIGAAKDAYDAAMKKVDSLEAACDAYKQQIAAMGDDDDDEEPDMSEEEDAAFAGEETPEEEAEEKRATGDAAPRIFRTKDGKPTLKSRLRAALDREAKLIAAASPAAIEKAAEERAKVLDAARPLVGDEFEGKGKTVHQIRLAAIDAALKADVTKRVARVQVGDRKLEKLSEADARRAFETLVAVVADGERVAADDDGGDEGLSRAIAGTGGSSAGPARGGRNAWLARSAADSRRHNPTKVTAAKA